MFFYFIAPLCLRGSILSISSVPLCSYLPPGIEDSQRIFLLVFLCVFVPSWFNFLSIISVPPCLCVHNNHKEYFQKISFRLCAFAVYFIHQDSQRIFLLVFLCVFVPSWFNFLLISPVPQAHSLSLRPVSLMKRSSSVILRHSSDRRLIFFFFA